MPEVPDEMPPRSELVQLETISLNRFGEICRRTDGANLAEEARLAEEWRALPEKVVGGMVDGVRVGLDEAGNLVSESEGGRPLNPKKIAVGQGGRPKSPQGGGGGHETARSFATDSTVDVQTHMVQDCGPPHSVFFVACTPREGRLQYKAVAEAAEYSAHARDNWDE